MGVTRDYDFRSGRLKLAKSVWNLYFFREPLSLLGAPFLFGPFFLNNFPPIPKNFKSVTATPIILGGVQTMHNKYLLLKFHLIRTTIGTLLTFIALYLNFDYFGNHLCLNNKEYVEFVDSTVLTNFRFE